ncbi:MAG: hypothetical protein AB7K68_07840 [Bacteriovoracia bacterium]
MKRIIASLFLITAICLAPAAFAHDDKAADGDHKVAHAHKHKHAKNCGHKAEKHGDHTDYEETVDGKIHHHKKHDKHYDECEGPEAEAAADSAKK